MQVDSTQSTLELANGVSLTWPKRLDLKELSYSYQKLGSFIDLLFKASTEPDYERLTDGKISNPFKDAGSDPVS